MLYLRTGLPGASKTLNTLKEICTESQFSKRPIYYHNIKLLLLDFEVCSSFSGWFYGVYLVSLDKFKRPKYDKRLLDIHSQDLLATLDDFPYLEQLFDSWLSFGGPLELWLSWVRRCYPTSRISDLNSYLELNPDATFSELSRFYLDWRNFPVPTLWYELPRSSVIVIDECQQWFPNRRVGSPVPKHCSEFETHRHKGYDVHLITQDAKLFDVHVRRLTGRHIHFYNPFTSKHVTRYEGDKVFNPDDYHEKKSTRSSIIKRDSSFYGVYWSADVHTHKSRFPKKILLIPVLVIGIFVGVYFVTSGSMFGDSISSNVVSLPSSSSGSSPRSSPSTSSSLLPIELFSNYEHPLTHVCDSVSFSGVSTVRLPRSYSSQIYLQCNVGSVVFVPSTSEDSGYWAGDGYSFFLTRDYLKELGYSYRSVASGIVLSYQELNFLLMDPFK